MEVNVLELLGIIDSGTSVIVLLFLVWQCQKGDEEHTAHLRQLHEKLATEYSALVQILMASLQRNHVEAELEYLRTRKKGEPDGLD